MKVVNIHDAKSHSSQLIADVEHGEEVLIARRGKPVARLVRWSDPAQPRRLGWARGKIVEVDPNWHEPLSDDDIREVFGDDFADETGA